MGKKSKSIVRATNNSRAQSQKPPRAIASSTSNQFALTRWLQKSSFKKVSELGEVNHIAIFSGIFAIFLTLFAMWGSLGFHFIPSAFLHVATNDPIAALAKSIDPKFYFVNDASHYDGVYYYAMALDPFAKGQAHTLIDLANYRYGHPMHGWLGLIVSLGQDKALPIAFVILTLIGAFLGTYMTAKIANYYGKSAWWGLFFIAQSGILYAAINSVTEVLMMALVMTVLYLSLKDKPNYILIGFVSFLLCFYKEPNVLILLAIIFWELLQARKQNIKLKNIYKKLVALSFGIPFLALWYLYTKSVFGSAPNTYGEGVFGLPFVGWVEAFKKAAQLQQGNFEQSQIGTLVVPVLTSCLLLYLITIVTSRKLSNVVQIMALTQIAISLCHGWLNLVYPHEILRDQIASLFLSAFALVLILPRYESVDTNQSHGKPVEAENLVNS